MIEQIGLPQLARLLADIETVLGYLRGKDDEVVGRVRTIDAELERDRRRHDEMAALLQTPLGEIEIGAAVVALDSPALGAIDFQVAGQGVDYWGEFHEVLLFYFSWLIQKKDAEMRLPFVESQLRAQRGYLLEVEGYVAND